MKEIRIDAPQTVIWRNPASIFKYNGWPSICRDERGIMYVTASSFRIQHVDPSGKNAIQRLPNARMDPCSQFIIRHYPVRTSRLSWGRGGNFLTKSNFI